SPAQEFLVVTECGLSDRLLLEVPQKRFYKSCKLCAYMKMITLEGTRDALRDLEPEITLPEGVRVRAARALERMLELGGCARRREDRPGSRLPRPSRSTSPSSRYVTARCACSWPRREAVRSPGGGRCRGVVSARRSRWTRPPPASCRRQPRRGTSTWSSSTPSGTRSGILAAGWSPSPMSGWWRMPS